MTETASLFRPFRSSLVQLCRCVRTGIPARDGVSHGFAGQDRHIDRDRIRSISGPICRKSSQYERWDIRRRPARRRSSICAECLRQSFSVNHRSDQVPADAKKLADASRSVGLSGKSSHVWPDQFGGRFDWMIFDQLRGTKRFLSRHAQVYLANVDPSSCCVGSAAGSTQWRLGTDASGFDNLYLAGTWIDTGFNTECIEAAVMSGMQRQPAPSPAQALRFPGEVF